MNSPTISDVEWEARELLAKAQGESSAWAAAHILLGDDLQISTVVALRALITALSAQKSEREEWQDISTAPTKDCAVLVYFGNRKWRDAAGNHLVLDGVRDQVERTAIGFYQDGCWREAGTGHDMFEEWRSDESRPTHWATFNPNAAPENGTAQGHVPSVGTATPAPSGEREALPEYGEWFPGVWEGYLKELVGWEDVGGWARLPATFRWHEFYDRLKQEIATRAALQGHAS